jgi:hypothetical protein
VQSNGLVCSSALTAIYPDRGQSKLSRAAIAHAVGLPFGRDPVFLQPGRLSVEIFDADRDVRVAGARLVPPAVVVEGELELLLLAGKPKK